MSPIPNRTRPTRTSPSSTDAQQCVEDTRHILSATARLLDDDTIAPRPADGDLDASQNAQDAVRRALAECLESHPGQFPEARAAALMLDSVAAQAAIKDALLQRRTEGGARRS